MADKTVTRVVVHPKLKLAVGGKLQRIPAGTEIKLAASVAKRLEEKGFVADPKAKPPVEVDDAEAKATQAEHEAAAKAAIDAANKAKK